MLFFVAATLFIVNDLQAFSQCFSKIDNPEMIGACKGFRSRVFHWFLGDALCGVPNFRDRIEIATARCSQQVLSSRPTRPPLHQRGPDSERSCRLASSQSESTSPGNANRRRRSEMK